LIDDASLNSYGNDDACLNSCGNHDALHNLHSISCTSCNDLKNEIEALKQVRYDMSAKLIEHNEMTARLEKDKDLLCTAYDECIEEETQLLREDPCATCEHLKSQNEVLLILCKILGAKLLDSHHCSHSDVDIFKNSSLQPEMDCICVKLGSLDVIICAIALYASSLASAKPIASSGVAQGISIDKGASCSNGTPPIKEKYHCTFHQKDGHVVEYCFHLVKHKS
jgi:hypothetical protein